MNKGRDALFVVCCYFVFFFDLAVECRFDDVSKGSFSVIFSVGLNLRVANSSHQQASHSLQLDYVASFKLDQPLTEEFMQSHFPRANAPAIAYPYLRTFISNTLLNGGYEPIILPSINFIELSKK